MIVFILFFFLGLVIAAASMLLYRFFTKATIHEVCFVGRQPFWLSIVAWIGMVGGLVIMGVQLGTGARDFRETFGWRMFVGSAALWLGGWLGGIVTTFLLQYFTLWATDPPAPAPPQEPKK